MVWTLVAGMSLKKWGVVIVGPEVGDVVTHGATSDKPALKYTYCRRGQKDMSHRNNV